MSFKDLYNEVVRALNRNGNSFNQQIDEISFRSYFRRASLYWIDQRIKVQEANLVIQEELSFLVKEVDLVAYLEEDYYRISTPKDFNYILKIEGKTDCGPIVGRLVSESKTAELYNSGLDCPSKEWGESFYSKVNKSFKFYVKGFKVESFKLVYYRLPTFIDSSIIPGGSDVDTDFTGSSLEEVITLTAALISGQLNIQDRFQTLMNENAQFN